MLALLIAAVGCGSGTARRQPSHLELVMPAAPIEVAGGRTREIQILVMGNAMDTYRESFRERANGAPPWKSLVTLWDLDATATIEKVLREQKKAFDGYPRLCGRKRTSPTPPSDAGAALESIVPML